MWTVSANNDNKKNLNMPIHIFPEKITQECNYSFRSVSLVFLGHNAQACPIDGIE